MSVGRAVVVITKSTDDKVLTETLDKHEYAAAGAISGSLTRFICQPLDVVKVRFQGCKANLLKCIYQLQVEPLSKLHTDSKYWGIVQAGRRIVAEEGPTALWKGHVPAQLLSITYGLIQFLSFEILTRNAREMFPQVTHGNREPVLYFVCGAIAGMLATTSSFPLDLVRTRLIAQGEPKVYLGIKHAVAMIYTKEGLRGFYKGLSPSVMQIAPHTGAQFAFYEIFTKLWHSWGHVPDHEEYSSLHANTVLGSFLCGSLAGASSKAFVYPLDLAKRRLQVQGFELARQSFGKVFLCQGLLSCLRNTARDEGLKGLFKGLNPSLLKAGLVTALNFTIYEQVCKALNNIHYHNK